MADRLRRCSSLTNFPILLAIAVYERQTRHTRATTFYEACIDLAERAVESLPLPIRRLSTSVPRNYESHSIVTLMTCRYIRGDFRTGWRDRCG
jgi:hypothetical protein